jgi:hypothetical protein
MTKQNLSWAILKENPHCDMNDRWEISPKLSRKNDHNSKVFEDFFTKLPQVMFIDVIVMNK